MDKGGGCIGHSGDIKANWPTVGGDKFADGSANLTDAKCVHPAVEINSQGPIFGFMGEFGAFAPFDDMIHSRQGEDAPDFGRAVGDAKDSVSTLEFSGSLEDQPQNSRSNVGNICKIAGQVGRLSI